MLIATLITLEDSQGTSPKKCVFIFTWFNDSQESLFELALWNLRTLIGWNALLNVEIKISKLSQYAGFK